MENSNKLFAKLWTIDTEHIIQINAKISKVITNGLSEKTKLLIWLIDNIHKYSNTINKNDIDVVEWCGECKPELILNK